MVYVSIVHLLLLLTLQLKAYKHIYSKRNRWSNKSVWAESGYGSLGMMGTCQIIGDSGYVWFLKCDSLRKGQVRSSTGELGQTHVTFVGNVGVSINTNKTLRKAYCRK